jgi:hypothetical protein
VKPASNTPDIHFVLSLARMECFKYYNSFVASTKWAILKRALKNFA